MRHFEVYGRKGKAKGGRRYDEEFRTPVFLTASNLKPFIRKELLENSKPVIFRPKSVTCLRRVIDAIRNQCFIQEKLIIHGE